jgi:hypothetical protein
MALAPSLLLSGTKPSVCDFGHSKMPTVELHSLIEDAFSVVAALHPQFDAASKPTPVGSQSLR